MIPRIKKILYTTDLSDNSTDVFKYAMNSAKKYDAGIIRNTFLGSSSLRVLRRTRKPVFIVPLPKAEADIGLGDI